MAAFPDRFPPQPKQIRTALDRICTSPPFEHASRLRSFLRFVVEATLDGRGDRIKGYTIGIEALGRSENFDPQADPIVRVEATRLRRALASYYGGSGAGDRVIIELPRGSYVPRFRHGRRFAPLLIWLAARSALQACRPGAWLLPPPPLQQPQADGRRAKNQQAESAPAARPRRPRAGRDRGDASDGRGDPRGL